MNMVTLYKSLKRFGIFDRKKSNDMLRYERFRPALPGFERGSLRMYLLSVGDHPYNRGYQLRLFKQMNSSFPKLSSKVS